MVMFLVLHPMKFTFLNSSDIVEHIAMLLTSTLALVRKINQKKMLFKREQAFCEEKGFEIPIRGNLVC